MWARKHLAVFLVLVSLTVSATAVVVVTSAPQAAGLLPFASYAELAGYVNGAHSAEQGSMYRGGLIAGPATPGYAAPVMGAPTTPSPPSYSGTNVQVTGVDELDMVKTDGTYIYIATQGQVDILRAYPATDLHVVSRISLGNLTYASTGNNATYAVGLFLNGSELLAVSDTYGMGWGGYGGGVLPPMVGAPSLVFGPTPAAYDPPRTFAFLFDVSEPAHPVLQHVVAVTGSASTGRMVGSTVYLVATQWIPEVNGTTLPPQLCVGGSCRDLAPGEIYRDPQSVDAWEYTNLLAIDLGTGAAKPMAVVTGGASVLYMSPTALYIAFYKWMIPQAGPMTMLRPIQAGGGWTTIYKLVASGLDITAAASANVDGTLLNQYSMDEWNGMLRVATTVRNFGSDGDTSSTYSNVYVFDAALAPLGSVTHLAPGESIFAVRFLGDRAYVVTFRRIDPLFVIDLSDPSSPQVTGSLAMPGFSNYLYPLDAGHLLGVGNDALPAEGNWSWYQGLKLSLYNVTNETAPKELANVSIGDRGTQSEVLNDPHAFLYIPQRELVVLPVDLAVINASQYPGGVPPYAWGNVVWQGAYVYRVNETTGFTYIGRITQGNGTVTASCGWYGSPTQIRRSLYIGDTLYTISGSEVMANSLTNLSEIASVVYATPSSTAYGCPILVE
ncbi:MAG TPA: beta-propeller domain-containing protein [Thermoplasmata archaeon]|nr:beta-propeller domain-containing protein [Thermoplasmata archaeon]